MTLQERLLEVLGTNAMRPQSIYRAMAGESFAGVDAALRGLLKAGAIRFELGMYERIRGRSVTVVVGQSRGNPVAAAAVAVLKSATPAEAPAPAVPAKTQRCKKCGEDKPLDAFQRSHLGNGILLKTCKACVGRKPQPAAEAAPKPHLTRAVSSSNELPKEEVRIAPKVLFPPGLRARLIESQLRKAEELQRACDQVATLRQELADIEILVRISTHELAP